MPGLGPARLRVVTGFVLCDPKLREGGLGTWCAAAPAAAVGCSQAAENPQSLLQRVRALGVLRVRREGP